LDLEENKNFTL